MLSTIHRPCYYAFAVSTSALIHSTEGLSLQRYKERNEILHLLIRKECPAEQLRIFIEREGRNFNIEDLKLEVEQLLYERLVRMLIQCRELTGGTGSTEEPTTTAAPTTTEAWTTTGGWTTTGAWSTTEPWTTTTTEAPTTTYPPTTESSDPCVSAVTFSESWRRDCSGSRIQPINNDYNCDTETIIEQGISWFRFTGPAGNRLRNTCPPSYSCGTRAGFWCNDTMPSSVGESRTARMYASWSGDCTYGTLQVRVMRCSSRVNDYIYLYEGGRWCDGGFCSMY